MRAIQTLRSLAADTRGGSVIEFALLGPVMIAMLMGILWSGVQMHSYNELRSIAADVSRYAVVEYQKSNSMSAAQLADMAVATAIRPPYGLDSTQLDVIVSDEISPVAGAKKLSITLSYTGANFLAFLGIDAPTQTFRRDVFVPA